MPTLWVSLGVQFLTGLVDVWGLSLKVDPQDRIYKELLALELTVQTIEFCFYVWFAMNTHRPNMTIYRYYDWFLTTPVMLVTLMAFLAPEKSLGEFLKKNTQSLSTVIVLNALMLICGWKAEMEEDQKKTWIACGFLFWTMTFSYIMTRFYPASKHPLFFYYVIIWGFYGIAAIFPYKLKNHAYNILDLFSKNAFGLYLTYVVYQKSQNKLRNDRKRKK